MPTGYTSKIYDGTEKYDWKDFIITCARAFGATVEMRDEPLDVKIPDEFTPNTYYKDSLKKSQDKLEYYKNMTLEIADKLAQKEYEHEIKSDIKYSKKQEELRQRYQEVKNDIDKWNPPTIEHNGLKEFAIKQLNESINWDCCGSYKNDNVVKKSAQEYIDYHIKDCLKDIENYTKKWNEEVERCKEGSLWVRQLKDSLK